MCYCAAGVRLDGFLAESEGLSGDLGLRHFANNYQVSSVKSGSGEPPDRAQICALMLSPFSKLFFSEPILGPPNVRLRHRNARTSVKKSDIARKYPSGRLVC